VMRKYIRLPPNFHEEIVGLENKLFSDQNIETINKLMGFYKLGAEFYSGLCMKKSTGYIMKLTDLLMDKNTVKVFERQKKRTNTQTAKHIRRSSETVDEVFLKGCQLPSNHRSGHKTMSVKIKSHTMTQMKSLNSSFTFKTRSIMNNSSVINDNDDFDYNTYINNKIKEFNAGLVNARSIFENDLKTQHKSVKEHIRKHHEVDIKMKSPRNKRMSVMTDLIANTFYQSGRRNSSHFYSEKVEKKKRQLMKMPSINSKKNQKTFREIFEEFFKKFHFLFFQINAESMCNEVMNNYNEYYKDKLTNFLIYEDQIKELILMTTGDQDNYETMEHIKNLVDNIAKERDEKIEEIEQTIKRLEYDKKKKEFTSEDFDKCRKVNEEFLNSLVEILK